MNTIRHPIHPRRLLAGVVLWMATAALPGAAVAQTTPDVGLVMAVSGEARYTHPGETGGAEPVQAFMKIRKGDRIHLSADSRIDLLFLSSGRREAWRGPVRLSLTAEGGVSEDPDVTPEVTAVKAPVSLAIEGSGLPLPRGRIARGGVNVVRGLFDARPDPAPAPRPVAPLSPADRAELASARRTYAELNAQSPPADPLPDLYYLSVLARYQQYGEMDRVIDRLRRRHGDLPALEKWRAYIRDHYPLRVRFFLLTPDKDCRRGPACFGLGDLGRFRKSGPFPVSSLPETDIQTGDILTFDLANTSERTYYCAVVNIGPSGNTEILFPESFSAPETTRLAPRSVLDLFSDAGTGLMTDRPGRETIRIYLSPEPLKEPDRSRLTGGATDDMTTIDATAYVSERRS